MRYEPPSAETIIAAGQRLGMAISSEAAMSFARYGAELAFAYRRVDDLQEIMAAAKPVGSCVYARQSPRRIASAPG